MPAKPGHMAPALALPTLTGDYDLARDAGENGTLIVFYRGLHCPLCIKQLGELNARRWEFADRKVTLLAVSADPEGNTRETIEKADAHDLTVAHSLPLKDAREDWGLAISTARPDSQEPERFSEPGIFYIRPDGTVWASWTQTTPFGRPPIDGLLRGIDFAIDKGYPPRGTYEGEL